MASLQLPRIIQGGMGVGVSNWRLARAVSRLGGLGVVSGTALDQVLVRRLQDGDPGGHVRRSLARFPVPGIAARLVETYYIAGGKRRSDPYLVPPLPQRERDRSFDELCVAANFVEVDLARAGHSHAVGINYLEKVQIPHLPSLYGAMLAGVSVVLMGAGIPLRIPGVLDALAAHRPVEYPLAVSGRAAPHTLHFAPEEMGAAVDSLQRPAFLAIVASAVLAKTLQRKSTGRVDGFVVEGARAGGHSAPPRGRMTLTDRGEPVYGERDRVDLAEIRELGLPFWLAGGYAEPHRLRSALDEGASGVQIGSAFALCSQSGLRPDLRRALLERIMDERAEVFNDPLASPTGFPFKVAALHGTLSSPDVYRRRPRICDLGYLREPYDPGDGSLAFRCPSEPVPVYLSKGGEHADSIGRKCLCNALLANIGHPQVRAGRHVEPALVTLGQDWESVRAIIAAHGSDSPGYSAADVMRFMA